MTSKSFHLRRTRRCSRSTYQRSRRRAGTVLIYVTVAMAAFTGMVSLAVDVGHVRVVKNQLQFAADASARYAAAGMSTSIQQAQNNAVAAAAQNTADGIAVVIDPNNDVAFGAWDPSTNTFAVLSGAAASNANAVRVTTHRSLAGGNPIALAFGGVIGKNTCDASAQSIALAEPIKPAGYISLGNMSFQNNAFVAKYDSGVTKHPNQGNASNGVRIGSNGTIIGHSNDAVHGDVVLGPSGSITGVTVTGSTLIESAPLSVPPLPAWSPQANPGGIPQIYAVANGTLPGGNYWFTSLTVTGTLTFSGPANVYISGDAVIDGTIGPASGTPSDLNIYQYGSHNFGDLGINGINITANVMAPGSDLVAKNALYFYGGAVFNSINVWNNAEFYYDAELGAADGSNVVTTVQ